MSEPNALVTNGNEVSDSSKPTSMPPPSNPQPNRVILESEAVALSTCLKNAAIRVGQIYGFYSDVRRLGIEVKIPRPPKALTAPLGREIEKYDQLVDSIESQILRAMSVLQRDLAREEQRARKAEEAAKAAEARPENLPVSLTSTPLTNDANRNLPADMLASTPTTSPRAPLPSASISRRPSAISISSLHRQPFPPKLDLSSLSLRFNPEDVSMFTSGLASPVTLAPKSARPIGPNEYPPDLMAFVSANPVLNQHVDIDLTLPEADVAEESPKLIDVGNTADKPIELDLDSMDIDMAMDLFGETSTAENPTEVAQMVDMFPSMAVDAVVHMDDGTNKLSKIKEPFLAGIETSGSGSDLFASLGVSAGQSDPQHSLESDQTSGSHPIPSAAAMFTNFNPTSKMQGLEAFSTGNVSVGNAPFDLNIDFSNLPNFFGNVSDQDVKFPLEMDQFLTTGGTEEQKGAAADGKKDEFT